MGVQQGGGNILYNTLKSKQNPLDREEKGRKTEGLKRKRLKNQREKGKKRRKVSVIDL